MATPFGDAENIRSLIEQMQKAMKPARDAMVAFSRMKASQETLDQMNRLSQQVGRTITPETFIHVNRLAQQIAEQFAIPQRQLQQMAKAAADAARFRIDPEKVEAWLKQGLPPNWRGLDSAGRATELLELMRQTGWCLVWVPRWEVIELVSSAGSDKERERILLNASKLIAEDVRAVMDDVTRPELVNEQSAARKAVATWEDGHPEAAQALASAGISSLIGGPVYVMKFWQARQRFGRDPTQQAWLDFRQWTVLELVAASLQPYSVERGDAVPATFSRHASAHSSSPVQFTEANAVAAVMLLAAFVRETQELLDANDARGN